MKKTYCYMLFILLAGFSAAQNNNIYLNGGLSIATAGVGGNIEVFISEGFAGTA